MMTDCDKRSFEEKVLEERRDGERDPKCYPPRLNAKGEFVKGKTARRKLTVFGDGQDKKYEG